MLRLLAPVAFASTALLAPRAADADSCSPARVMVVLDKSSSMQTGFIANVTKWNTAVGGLNELMDTYQMKAEFGLMTYPQPNQCGPGALVVEPALNNKTAFANALSTPPPTSGNYTPMAQTLDVAATETSWQTATGSKHVVLITDGWQYCVPYDPNTRYTGTAAIEKLKLAGITPWIVGFGAEVDATALNRMAVAAATMRPNCNPNGTNPAAADNCYFQVNNAAELVAALKEIAGSVSVETCDGVDNDCNGQVDDGLSRGCTNACGSGTETCQAGSWRGCDAPAPATETCDGDDNDCDGEVDEPTSGQCGLDEVCYEGACQPPNSDSGVQAGCACDSGSTPGAGTFAPFAVLGLLLLRRRRRS